MLKAIFQCLLLMSPIVLVQAQHYADTVKQLEEVIVRAYSYSQSPDKVPTSISYLSQNEIVRFNESTLVPSMNGTAGVRMEERSPGSYRLSLRGSTLRAPFGVRNVKLYWNDIPFTDPGGNTYLNQVDPSMIGSMEIIKGPGSSLYGAGTGGVLLLRSPVISSGHALQGAVQIGSFGGELWNLSYEEANDKSSHQVQVLHQQSDGYRNHTRLARDVVNSVFKFELDDRQRLETYIFYSDLFYETPGGLTLNEFNTNPKQARQATATTPGAEEQRASVHLQSFFSGVSHEYFFSQSLHNKTSVYGNLVKFENPSIRNYEHRNEQSFGARSVTTFIRDVGSAHLKILGGGEIQWGFMPSKTYQNLGGKEGMLLIDDETKILVYSLFGQGEMRWKKISVTAGLSYNAQLLNFHRLSDINTEPEKLTTGPTLMPRLAVQADPHDNISLFASMSRGFSPPTLAEINASNGVFNKSLEPETGMTFEVGARFKLLQNKMQAEVTAYTFKLDETIVIRRDDDGGEYFVNAGNTDQQGVEFSLRYNPMLTQSGLVTKLIFWNTYTYNDFRFGNYTKGTTDLSGNQLTGSPKHVLNLGVDVALKNNLYLKLTYLYTSKLPLTDDNSVYADAFSIPGFRLGYQLKRLELYAGGENLLNETYSLGNDLNAFGGRYYNAAPARSFYAGVKFNVAF